jgi:hypothetical protein
MFELRKTGMSAKGAASATKPASNRLAPHSVLPDFLRSFSPSRKPPAINLGPPDNLKFENV